jgi:hypothetical protein
MWLDRDEYDPAQMKAYISYLYSNLRYYLADRKLELVEVHDMPDLLDVIDDCLPFDLKGTTDVLVMAEGCLPQNMTDVRLLIEVKKENILKHGVQKGRRALDSIAIALFIAVDLMKPDTSAIVMLTNLTNVWSFCWVGGEKSIHQLNLHHPKNAFDFIKRSVEHEDWKGEFSVPYTNKSFKRLKLMDMIPEGSESNFEEIIERYQTIADTLRPDVAMARECAVVRSIPLYSSIYF